MTRPLFLYPTYWQLGFSPERFFQELFGSAGALWLVVEVVSYFAPNFSPEIKTWWWLLFIVGLVVALFRAQPLLRACHKLEGRDILFEIVVGNIWTMEGEVVISATTTFDTDRSLIASDSLQGQFTKKYYTSSDHLAYDLKAELERNQGRAVSRAGLKLTEYPVGTVVRVKTPQRAVYLLALTHLNDHGNASASIEDLRVALPRLWEYISERGNFTSLLVPIIGGGRARISISRNILVSILREAHYCGLSKRLHKP